MNTGYPDDYKGIPTGVRRISGVLLVTLLLLVACGGGGGGGSNSPPPPSGSISYPSGTQTFVVGTAITPITPTITGSLSTFTVNPALPAGLALDSAKGTISGTPTAIVAAANYTVTAAISGGGSTSASVSIAVNDVAPSQVSYGASSFTFSATMASSTITPKSSGGAAVSWSINPALPAGLNFSTTDGSISGTPSAASPSMSYVVTAANSGGKGTVTLTIEVDAAPLLNLGHQTSIEMVRATAANVFSIDSNGNWILWDYTQASVVANGISGCVVGNNLSCAPTPAIDMAGSTAAIATPTGLEVHATSDGHVLATITTNAVWWKLATDGSYIAAGGQSGLSAWSTTGQLLFSRSGDYSKAMAFATPGAILVGAGAAGQSVVETIAVPSGTATTGPQFNGQFGSWFTDGGRFTTLAGTTVLIYSKDGVQQGSLASVPAGVTVMGQGNWVWTYPGSGATLNIYPATGSNPAAAATYTFTALATPYASGSTIGVITLDSTAFSLIDLSGTTPVKTDYTAPVELAPTAAASVTSPYVAVSASQWLVGNQSGVLLDGASLAGTARFFGFGRALSVAGGTGYFAVATASGIVLYFDANTLALQGRIARTADKVVSSADGTLLVAQVAINRATGDSPVEVYALPAGNLQYTWPYNYTGSPGSETPQDINLSASGTVLGQVLFTAPGGTAAPYVTVLEASSPNGGPMIFSDTSSSLSALDPVPTLRISPDGTLIASSLSGLPNGTVVSPGTNLRQNGTLVTAFSGLPAGWLDNSRLLVNDYVAAANSSPPAPKYSGCTLYGPNGSPTGGACALPSELTQFQPVTADTVYVPATNQIISVSTGAVSWISGDPSTPSVGALAGSHVVFVSGSSLVVQSH